MNLTHSQKRTSLTWALVVLFSGLLAIILFLQQQTKAENLVLIRTAESVSRITIERKDQQTIVLEKQDRWWVTSPVNLPANDQRIIPLLTVYTNPDPGYPINNVDLTATGLENPDITVTFNDYKVSIGDISVDESKRHALHGERIRFVPDWVYPFLQGGLSAVADLTVFGDNLNTIELPSGLTLDADAIASAKTLTAQQLVAWPRSEQPNILSELSVSVTLNNELTQWMMITTDRYVAMQPENSTHAYILPTEDAPWLSE